jgi:Protein of unknown function (DUF3089)
MDTARTRRSTGARALLIAVLGVAALAIPGAFADAASAESVWLCRPGLANNPCLTSEETTVEFSNGKSFVENPKPAVNPPIDCFYVYPTVSSVFAANAPEQVEPEETAIAEAQASRFSQACKVYAPIYPQITVAGLEVPGLANKESGEKAFNGVLAAFEEYLARFNDGRGFVLIGHSQGSAMLELLIKDVIEKNPALESKLVSAVILGGQVVIPAGKTTGGTFATTPICSSSIQIGCVWAYSSFLKEPPTPPSPSLFGRPEGAFFNLVGGPPTGVEKPQIACNNPTLIGFQSNAFRGLALSYYPTKPFPGVLAPFVQVPKAPTPWVATPAEYSAQCMHQNSDNTTWLQLTKTHAVDAREALVETLGPEWGTHLDDVGATLGNTVPEVAVQGALYRILHH